MKYFLQENFKESICFTPLQPNRSSCTWSESCRLSHRINIGAGLPDEEISISFAKMIHHKIKAQETGTSFPLPAENLLEELDKYDPIKEMYNAI